MFTVQITYYLHTHIYSIYIYIYIYICNKQNLEEQQERTSESNIHNRKKRQIFFALQYEVVPRYDQNKYVMTHSFKVIKHEWSNYAVMMIMGWLINKYIKRSLQLRK